MKTGHGTSRGNQRLRAKIKRRAVGPLDQSARHISVLSDGLMRLSRGGVPLTMFRAPLIHDTGVLMDPAVSGMSTELTGVKQHLQCEMASSAPSTRTLQTDI